MFVMALEAYIDLLHLARNHAHNQHPSSRSFPPSASRDWVVLLNHTRTGIRSHLWNATEGRFLPHLYMDEAGAAAAAAQVLSYSSVECRVWFVFC